MDSNGFILKEILPMYLNRLFMLLLILSITVTSCVPDEEEVLESTSLPVDGSQCVPDNDSKASGIINAKFSKATNVLTYTLTWNGLSGSHTGIQLRQGGEGTNGELLKNIQTSGSSSGSITENWTVPAATKSTVESGGTYIEIRTNAYPTGEIRGQIKF